MCPSHVISVLETVIVRVTLTPAEMCTFESLPFVHHLAVPCSKKASWNQSLGKSPCSGFEVARLGFPRSCRDHDPPGVCSHGPRPEKNFALDVPVRCSRALPALVV